MLLIAVMCNISPSWQYDTCRRLHASSVPSAAGGGRVHRAVGFLHDVHVVPHTGMQCTAQARHAHAGVPNVAVCSAFLVFLQHLDSCGGLVWLCTSDETFRVCINGGHQHAALSGSRAANVFLAHSWVSAWACRQALHPCMHGTSKRLRGPRLAHSSTSALPAVAAE